MWKAARVLEKNLVLVLTRMAYSSTIYIISLKTLMVIGRKPRKNIRTKMTGLIS